jgi:hypothetical protein
MHERRRQTKDDKAKKMPPRILWPNGTRMMVASFSNDAGKK